MVKTGPAENFECSVFVYCFHTKEILKVSAGLGAAASRGGVGDFEPYFPGDRVIVTYLYGDSNKGCITGRTFQTQGLSEELLNGRLPQPGTVSPSGEQINPNPTPVVNNSALYGGFASIKTRPLII